MESIQSFLKDVKLGGKQGHRNMVFIPLLAPDAGEPDYLILEEALGQGVVEITEVSQAGAVFAGKISVTQRRKGRKSGPVLLFFHPRIP